MTHGRENWLRLALHDREVDRAEIIHQAKVAGFAERSIERSATRIGVRRLVAGFGKAKRSLWTLMPAKPSEPPVTVEEVSSQNAGVDSPPYSRARAMPPSLLSDRLPALLPSHPSGGNGAHAPVDVGPSAVQRTFLATFYRSATPARVAEVLRLLAGVLTAHGAAYEGSLVRAMSRAHLDEECSRLIKIPPRSADKAIDFVLARLRAHERTLKPIPLEVVPTVAERP